MVESGGEDAVCLRPTYQPPVGFTSRAACHIHTKHRTNRSPKVASGSCVQVQQVEPNHEISLNKSSKSIMIHHTTPSAHNQKSKKFQTTHHQQPSRIKLTLDRNSPIPESPGDKPPIYFPPTPTYSPSCIHQSPRLPPFPKKPAGRTGVTDLNPPSLFPISP